MKKLTNFIKKKTETPLTVAQQREKVKELRNGLRAQERNLEREANSLKREMTLFEKEIVAAAQRNDNPSCRILAKELAHARKAHERLIEAKSQLNNASFKLFEASVSTAIVNSVALASSGVAAETKILLPQYNSELRNIAKQLNQIDIVGDVIEDGLELTEDADIDEAADMEIDEVITSILSRVAVPQSLPQAVMESRAAIPMER